MCDEHPMKQDPTVAPATAHSETSGAPSAADAGVLTPRVLELDRLRPYDHNPRHGANPEYDRIKASIRAAGLGQPLVVTQRPGEADYLVAAGGNTRLQILKELHCETGQARFARVPCLYKPWTREADVLLDHLKENDLRGGLSFLDKARALAEVKRLIEAEGDAQAVNQTQLAAILKARGFGLSQGLISRMAYAVETLLPLIPQALLGGLGRPQIERIRSLERAARVLWFEHRLDAQDDYDTVFATLCRRYDAPQWDIDSLRRALEAEIAERSGISLQGASVALDDRLAGRRTTVVHRESPSEAADDIDDEAVTRNAPARGAQAAKERTGSSLADTDRDAVSRKTALLPVRDSQGQKADDSKFSPAAVRAPSQSDPAIGMVEPGACDTDTPGMTVPTDLNSLRARAWTLARRLAQRHGLGDLILPLSGNGLGFLLRDVPDPALAEQLDEETLAQVSMVWWVLAACSEMTVARLDHLLPALEDGSVLKQALAGQEAQLLFSRVWTLDPGHTAYRLWRRLDDRGWDELLGLMDTYRALYRTAQAAGVSLWR